MFDVLSRLITKAHLNGSFQGISLASTAPALTHLFFADDAIIFAKDTTADISQLITILNTFTEASRQMINTAKSGIICGARVSDDLRSRLSTITAILIWNNPRKYLGIPADWGRSKIQGLSWVKERVLARMEGWNGSLLNQAGKEVLIKSVVQAIPSYVMSILALPKTFCADLSATVARFWWARNGRNRGIHWKNINILCSPKDVGGLGFKEFSKMSKALLAKQAWRLIQEPNSYWAENLKSIYLPNSIFWNAKEGKTAS